MEIKLKGDQFNRLFPFYILIDDQLKVEGFGKSIAKILPLSKGSNFNDLFSLKRPAIEKISISTLHELNEQLLILEYAGDKQLSLRGQVEYLENENSFLFFVTPWFSSMDHVKEFDIKINDFAIHDSLIDVLHVLKTQEIVTEEVKELLETVKKQKNDLQRLSLIAEETVNGVVITDTHGKIEWVNKGFLKITGYTLKEVIHRTPGSILQGKESSKETIQYLSNQLAEKKPFVCEVINYNKKGIPYWVRINGQPLYNSRGIHTGFFAIEEDISKEKEAFIQLKEYEERFKVALEKIGDNVWIYDFETKKTEFSNNDTTFHTAKDNSNSSHSESWWDCLHPDDKHLLDNIDEQYKACQISHHSTEYRIITQDGSTKWILDRGVVFEKNAAGLPIKIIGTHTDITRLKEVESALNNQKKFYENILNSVPADIAVLDKNHRYLFLNPIAVKDPKVREWIIGKTDEEYLEFKNKPNEVADKRKALFRKALISKKLESFVEELTNKEGKIEYHFRNMYPVLNEQGEVDQVIGYGLNITDRIMIEKELQQAKKETEEAAKAKETFLVNMSHEIRTPMNGIMGITDLLAKTHLTARQKEFAHLIKESANNLLVIVNDVLDFEKLIAGKIELECIPFNIGKKLKYAIETFRYKAEEKDLYIQFNNNLPEGLILEGDPFRLNQIIFNLIGNAIKFTDHGGITLTTSIKRKEANKMEVQITVSDTGIGIQKKQLDNIFNPYVQAKAEISRKYGGTGLGLSICKNLIEIQKGTIEVISKENKGSNFIVTIPYRISKLKTLNDKPVIDTGSMKGKKILVAEDVEINQFVVRNILELWGCETTIVENGKKAIDAVKKNNYDLILMDIQMPELNGFEATDAIKKMAPEKAAIPIIAVTANSLKGINERYKRSGMTDYLIKPYNEEKLFAIMEKVMGNSKSTNGELVTEEVVEKKPSKLSENLALMTGGNELYAKKLAEIFLRTSPEMYSQMEVALGSQDWDTLARNAHKFASSVGALGMDDALILVRKIEDCAKNRKELNNIGADLDTFNSILKETINELKTEFF